MASSSCHAFDVTKRFRLERIVRCAGLSTHRSSPPRPTLDPQARQTQPPKIASRGLEGKRTLGSSAEHAGHDLRGDRRLTATTTPPPRSPPTKPDMKCSLTVPSTHLTPELSRAAKRRRLE